MDDGSRFSYFGGKKELQLWFPQGSVLYYTDDDAIVAAMTTMILVTSTMIMVVVMMMGIGYQKWIYLHILQRSLMRWFNF